MMHDELVNKLSAIRKWLGPLSFTFLEIKFMYEAPVLKRSSSRHRADWENGWRTSPYKRTVPVLTYLLLIEPSSVGFGLFIVMYRIYQ